jgi:SAM-dependent methyltransferase
MTAPSTGAAPEPGQHWDAVCATRESQQVSWYQPTAETSLRLLDELPGSVVDVGAGASTLVDGLLDAGRTDVTIVDVSAEGLQRTRARLGSRADTVRFIVADLLDWDPGRQFDAWHDRALFHFLTDPEQRNRYVNLAIQTVRPGGGLVVGAFAEDGPDRCSGLPTARYSSAELAAAFAPHFALEHTERQVHTTPAQQPQSFTWVRLRRTGA